ncbi:MAG TPA: 6,7-dimethyl-8-ribityllumazine synthase [Rhabdaerophilum sp.]|nr:6,7-dimethyl-8-ribityllumazine synthase [Rhabdaerophilum sp.]
MAEAARRALSKVDASGAHFVIVEGRFYDDLNDMLVAGARTALEAAGASVEVVTVPGALEIPIAIEMIRRQAADGQRRADGFVALGVVIRGETTHYEIVSNESARELIALGTREALAFGNGILTVENHDQAEVRANPAKADKGGDAARAALVLLALKRGNVQ